MEKREIQEAAIRRNVSWIEVVERSLGDFGNDRLTKQVMKAAGQKCAQQILTECENILGKKPETVDELIEATNRRRKETLNIDSLWEREGNSAHLLIRECGCTLVKAGLAKPNPVHCLCSVGLIETYFSSVCHGSVNVEIVRAIGQGDEVCEFHVTFTE